MRMSANDRLTWFGITLRIRSLMIFLVVTMFTPLPVPAEKVGPVTFGTTHNLLILDKELKISENQERSLVLFSLIEAQNGRCLTQVIVEKTFGSGRDLRGISIANGDFVFVLFPTSLIIVNAREVYVNVVEMSYSASMYLYGDVLYFELAHEVPYGIAFDYLRMKRLSTYSKVRPFDVSKALLAQELK